jgi:hypothetical protein
MLCQYSSATTTGTAAMRENVRIFGSESGRAGSGELVTLFISCKQYAL